MSKNNCKLILIGGLAGMLNGLFGAGGGLILVPLLVGWIRMDQKQAFATSVAVMLPISIVSLVLFLIRDGDIWPIALPFSLGGVIGGMLSAKLFNRLSIGWLHRLFAILILYGGVRAVLLI